MNHEMLFKAVLGLVALLVVLWRHRRSSRLPDRKAGVLLSLVALVSVGAYYNFGGFHGRVFIHYWEQFHYFLNSKYFPELGYDGLYVASVAAQRVTHPQSRIQPYIRDLRSNQIVPVSQVADHRKQVVQRFELTRFEAFVRDHQHFLDVNDLNYLRQIRKDHGYNPTPSWTFTARLFSSWLPANRSTLTLLGLLDVGLLMVTLLFVCRTYGWRAGCISAAIFGVGYGWRFYWVGGAFLRQDWLAALVIGVCMLKRRRFLTAGVLFAYATLSRIFPLLFLFTLGVVGLRTLLARADRRWLIRFAAGYAGAIVLLFSAGALTGRGFDAWREFGVNIEQHSQRWITNNVGLKNVVLYDAASLRSAYADHSLPEPWAAWQDVMKQRQQRLRIPLVLAQLGLLLLTAAAAWRASPDQAAVLGLAAVFALVQPTGYYWLMLLLLPLRPGISVVVGWLALNSALYWVHFASSSYEMRYGVMSYGLLLLFLVWLGPDAVKTLRERFRVPPELAAD